MPLPLEDNYMDVIGKAQRGLNIPDSMLASRAGVTMEAVQRLRAGQFDAAAAGWVATVLRLNPRALVDLGRNAYAPAEVTGLDGVAQFPTEFGDIMVNAYLVWDPRGRDAAAFDTGGDCSGILEKLHEKGLTLRYVFLTHTHGDHIYDLDRLLHRTGAAAFVSSREPLEGAESFEPGREFVLDSLTIGTRLTWGHSPGGTTYVIHGLKKPAAIVGDAMFAGSMGGGKASYEAAIRTDREEILSLPDETVICPGHGPMTTVGEEKEHNPFFALG